jgi:hypothetical protein
MQRAMARQAEAERERRATGSVAQDGRGGDAWPFRGPSTFTDSARPANTSRGWPAVQRRS